MRVPEVLIPYVGVDFIPYKEEVKEEKKPVVKNEAKKQGGKKEGEKK